MTPVWAFHIPDHFAGSLGRLRLNKEIEVASDNVGIWLRGASQSEKLKQELKSLPAGELYDVLPTAELRRSGSKVPMSQLPSLVWQPIQQALVLELPGSNMAGKQPSPIPLKLVRNSDVVSPNVLLLSCEEFAHWCETAPEIRLNPLRFAVRRDGMVAVRGDPLPPLCGARYVERDGIAVPAGYGWRPAVGPQFLARMWELNADDLGLWLSDEEVECIAGHHFLAATRSSVRATRGSMRSGQA